VWQTVGNAILFDTTVCMNHYNSCFANTISLSPPSYPVEGNSVSSLHIVEIEARRYLCKLLGYHTSNKIQTLAMWPIGNLFCSTSMWQIPPFVPAPISLLPTCLGHPNQPIDHSWYHVSCHKLVQRWKCELVLDYETGEAVSWKASRKEFFIVKKRGTKQQLLFCCCGYQVEFDVRIMAAILWQWRDVSLGEHQLGRTVKEPELMTSLCLSWPTTKVLSLLFPIWWDKSLVV
jgi:hypothetical protein